MIKTYKSLSIFKRIPKDGEEVNPNAPSYDMLASYKNPDGSYEKGINVGGVWLKDSVKGKYFSCLLNKPYEAKKGYVIVDEQELNDMITAYNKVVLGGTVEESAELNQDEIPF